MLVLVKVSARRYMALAVGSDSGYLGANPRRDDIPEHHGINFAAGEIIAGPARYDNVHALTMEYAKAHGLIVAYADSHAKALTDRAATIGQAIAALHRK